MALERNLRDSCVSSLVLVTLLPHSKVSSDFDELDLRMRRTLLPGMNHRCRTTGRLRGPSGLVHVNERNGFIEKGGTIHDGGCFESRTKLEGGKANRGHVEPQGPILLEIHTLRHKWLIRSPLPTGSI
eukprot:scaffold6436_cov52-Attheya_sp.AAC.1